jgi:hypothetical protein
MNSHQWERAHKIAQEIHAADLAWTAALDAKIRALKINNYKDVQAAEEVILTESLRLAQYGVTLATIMLELGPSPIPSIKASFQIPQPDQAPNLIDTSAEDEEWAAYNAAQRIDAYPSTHNGFKRVLQTIQERPPLSTPEQDETLPSDVLGEDFYSDYAEWFFESGEFPALPGDEAVAS